ncbi:MAG: sugar ABC transporter ATP-binding protein [Verrucomicrobia bacterium]|nr:sugar ABC transporter ATP-binding protein [Verrucomicrobiota bacterium]
MTPLSPPSPGLELRGIDKAFGPIQALHRVDFDLRPGEIHALIGENGAGKSTLIKTVAGALEPDAGEIGVQGRTFRSLTPRLSRELGIAVIYQHPPLFPDLTVAENMRLFLGPARAFCVIDRSRQIERARECLAAIGSNLDPTLEAGRLSMPEQQLVEIARALAAGAQWLILDEPTAALGADDASRLHQVLHALRAKGAGCCYISHRLEDITGLADRVTVLRDGRKVACLPAAEATGREMIRLMVGGERPPSDSSPPHVAQPDSSAPGTRTSPDSVLMRVEGLGCKSSHLREISFELRRGEILGLAGLVGSGRTELARVLFGLDPLTQGTIRIEGQLCRIESPADALSLGIAYLPEDRRRHGIIAELSVAANTSMASFRRMFPRGWLDLARERCEAQSWIERLRIRCQGPETLAGTLSGGNQQKTALARWLATSPRVLIADEPTQGIDVGAKAEIHRLLQSLASEGLAILLLSSDWPELLQLSDRIGVMRQGRLTAFFSKQEASPEAILSAALGHEVTAA